MSSKSGNATQNEFDVLSKTEELDFDELEEKLQRELEKEIVEMQFLEEEKKKIGNLDMDYSQ